MGWQHSTEEFTHAGMLANRITRLGGDPIRSPKKWYDWSPCNYDAPDDPYVASLLDQNIAGEQCAIGVYNNLVEVTKDTDRVTYNTALAILEQEIEHEEELQSLKEDLELMVSRGFK